MVREIPEDREVAGQPVRILRDGAYEEATLLRRFRNGWVRVRLADGTEVSLESWQVAKGGS